MNIDELTLGQIKQLKSLFEYSTKTYSLMEFSLSNLIKRVIQIDPTLN